MKTAPEKLSLNMPPPLIAVRSIPGSVATKASQELDKFVTHPGRGISPQKIVDVYRQAEYGYPMQQVDLFEDIIENDGHLRANIESRTLAVAGKDWQLQAGGDDPQSIKAAEILEQTLREANFDEAIANIVAARYFGYSGTEIVWDERDGNFVPKWFVCVPFRRFIFDKNDRPLLMNSNSMTTGDPLQAGKWIFTANSSTVSSIIPRAGLMRTATWYAVFKRWSWRDWVIYAEKFGIPLVIGKYEQGASEENIRVIEETVTDIGEAGQAVMSSNMEVDIREAQRGGDSNGLHRSIVSEANAEISKLITGSTLTQESGGPGSFALGKVHETRAFDLVLSDAKMVAKRFEKDVAQPFLAFNGFDRAKVPRLKIHLSKDENSLTRAKTIQTLHSIGMAIDQEQLREEFQLRTPSSEEQTLRIEKGESSSDGSIPATE